MRYQYLKKIEDLTLLKNCDWKNEMLYLRYTCFYIGITLTVTRALDGDNFGLQ